MDKNFTNEYEAIFKPEIYGKRGGMASRVNEKPIASPRNLGGKKCLSCWNFWVINTDSWAAKLWGPTNSYFIYYGRCTRKGRVKAAIFCGQRKQPHKLKKSQIFRPEEGILMYIVTPAQRFITWEKGHSGKSGQTSKWPCRFHSCGIPNACKTSASEPVTSLLFAHVPDCFTNLHIPKSWADQKFPLQTTGSACWTPPVIAGSCPRKGNQLETPVRQRGFNILYIGCQLSLSTFKCPKR